MKTKHALPGLAAMAALCLFPSAARSQAFSFEVFESEGVEDPADLEPIVLAGHLLETGTGVGLSFTNLSVPGDLWVTERIPTITRIYFEDPSALLLSPSFDATGGTGQVQFDFAPGGNLPGGENIGFESAFHFAATPPPVANGIDPLESAEFVFEGSNYGLVYEALASGDLRIGLHVQQIGKCGEDSASYINRPIPEPTASLLGGLGLLLILLRRSR